MTPSPLPAPWTAAPTRGRRALARACTLALGSLLGTSALAQSIYTCTDAQGRRLTSDRPIAACIDREQRELNRDGTLKRVIAPTLTALEREAREAQEREAAQQRQRERDALRRDQALITRYPDKAAHDAGRADELTQAELVVATIESRIAELAAERKQLNEEMEFYAKDPSKAPAKLQRALRENTEAVQTQRRAIAAQREEQARIHARFDAEAQRLQPLWQARPADPAKR